MFKISCLKSKDELKNQVLMKTHVWWLEQGLDLRISFCVVLLQTVHVWISHSSKSKAMKAFYKPTQPLGLSLFVCHLFLNCIALSAISHISSLPFSGQMLSENSLHSRGGWWEALKEDGLIVKAGMESLEWSQTCGLHMFDMFDSNPFIPLQPLR